MPTEPLYSVDAEDPCTLAELLADNEDLFEPAEIAAFAALPVGGGYLYRGVASGDTEIVRVA